MIATRLWPDSESARGLFGTAYAYASIRVLGHLSVENITEVRSRVLLLMTAAIAAKFGKDEDRAIAEEHLNGANAILNELPARDGQRSHAAGRVDAT
jgi:hypothetical protein